MYNIREIVRLKSMQKEIKDSLKANDLGVGIQSPQEYRDASKTFNLNFVEDTEQRNQTTHITGSKIFINKKLA